MKKCKLAYKIIENEKNLKLFSDDFFRIHSKKYKMIINYKISKLLKDYVIPKDTNPDKLKVKLIILGDYNFNFRRMFEDTTISKFSIGFDLDDNNENKQNDVLKNNKEDNNKEINNLEDSTENKSKDFYQEEMSKSDNDNEKEYKEYNNLRNLSSKRKNINFISVSSKININENLENIAFNSYCFKKKLSKLSNLKQNNDSFINNNSIKSYEAPFSIKVSEITQNNSNNLINSSENIIKEFCYFLDNQNKKTEVKNLSFMFLKCKYLESIKGFSQFDISKCLDISGLFDSCNSLKSIPDISQFQNGIPIMCLT